MTSDSVPLTIRRDDKGEEWLTFVRSAFGVRKVLDQAISQRDRVSERLLGLTMWVKSRSPDRAMDGRRWYGVLSAS